MAGSDAAAVPVARFDHLPDEAAPAAPTRVADIGSAVLGVPPAAAEPAGEGVGDRAQPGSAAVAQERGRAAPDRWLDRLDSAVDPAPAPVAEFPAAGSDTGGPAAPVADLAPVGPEGPAARRATDLDALTRTGRGRSQAAGRRSRGQADVGQADVGRSDVGRSDAGHSDAGHSDAGPAPGRSRRRREGSSRRAGGRRGAPAELDPDADPVAVAREICLRLLTDRARTRQELAQTLARRGVPDGAAEQVLGRFDEVGLIDDAAFAEQWVRSRHAVRGLGRRALAVELRRKGVADDVAREALEGVDGDAERERARDLVARKLRSATVTTPEQRATVGRRLVGMLARKGYGPGVAYEVVKEALAAHGAKADELDAEPDPDS